MTEDQKKKLFYKARRITGIAKFERNCRKTSFGGRLCLAWRVPGTQEAGRWAMLNRATQNEYQRLLADWPVS